MKKLRFRSLLLGFLGLALLTWSQTIQYAYQTPLQIFTSVTTSGGFHISVTGAAFHVLTWNNVGTVATCQIQADSSVDGITWNSGDVIPTTLCTTSGTVTSSSHVVNFIRINITAISGAGATVSARLTGYVTNPSGGGGGGLADPGSNGPIKRTALNVTAVATSADLIALWSGTCNVGTFLRGDGACAAAGGITNGAANNVVTKSNGTNLVASSITDDGTTVTTTDTGGLTLSGNGAPITSTQGTITTSHPAYTHTVTWNAGGVVFTNWLSNITCTAAAANSIGFGVGQSGTDMEIKYGNATCGNGQLLFGGGMGGGGAAAPLFSTITNPSTGITLSGTSIFFSNSGAYSVQMTTTGPNLGSAKIYGISSNTNPALAGPDTGISRTAAAVIAVGNGGAADESGLFRAANGCRVAADITLTVNTAITVCTWNLPGVAKVWAWQCQIPWVISAGSGTNTISVGVNASQTPAATTTATAKIFSTNTGTQTSATVNLSASGAVNVLTSGTITPAATVFPAEVSGVLSANASAGTFAITMTAAGTTATALAKAGANCILF